MKGYPKIESVYKRDLNTGKFLEGQWKIPEFEYLAGNQWEWTEIVDGTNIRVIWIPEGTEAIPCPGCPPLSAGVTFRGKADYAQIPAFLLKRLQELFPPEKFISVFPDVPVCLYGEGYGARINTGKSYIPNDVSFILFDIRIGRWWVSRMNVFNIAEKLDILAVPTVFYGTIYEAINLVRDGFKSTWGDFIAEGLVGKPEVPLFARNEERIIVKLKHRDFGIRENDNGKT